MRIAVACVMTLLATSGCSSCNSCNCGPLVCFESSHYCRRIDDCHTTCVARRCAWQALGDCASISGDYRLGFTQAYIDTALGATGTLPPIPPRRYWNVCFRSPCGDQRAADWYAGYRDGVASASAWCNGDCNRISSSGAGYHFGPVRQADFGGYYGPGDACSAQGAPQIY